MSDATDQQPFDFEAYRRFIGQIELRDIWLSNSKVENRRGPSTPDKPSIQIDNRPAWEVIPGGFRAKVRYRMRFKSSNQIEATIEATYAADYSSAMPMTDEQFGAFSTSNLPLVFWPYLRAFIADTLGRMGWLPFTLPAFKINTFVSSESGEPRPTRRRRTLPPTNDETPF